MHQILSLFSLSYEELINKVALNLGENKHSNFSNEQFTIEYK